MSYECVVHTSMHPEYPEGTVIRVETLEDVVNIPFYKWADVKLANGVTRSVLVKDIKTI